MSTGAARKWYPPYEQYKIGSPQHGTSESVLLPGTVNATEAREPLLMSDLRKRRQMTASEVFAYTTSEPTETPPYDPTDVSMTADEVERAIKQYEQELGMPRNEFLEQVQRGAEPDNFAAMMLKHLLLY